MESTTVTSMSPKARCRVCKQPGTRYIEGRKRTFYCDTHGPTKAEDWLRLHALGTGDPDPNQPTHFNVSAPAALPERKPAPVELPEPRVEVQTKTLIGGNGPAAAATSALKVLDQLVSDAEQRGYKRAMEQRAQTDNTAKLLGELEQARTEAAQIEQTARDIAEERDRVQRELIAAGRERAELERRVAVAEKHARELSADNLNLDTKVRAGVERIRELETERDAIRRSADTELSDLSQKTAQLARNLTKLQQENEEYRRMLDEITAPAAPPKPAEPEPSTVLETVHTAHGDGTVTESVRRMEPRPPRARAEQPAETTRVPLLADFLRHLKRGKTGLVLGTCSASEKAYKALDDASRDKVNKVLQILAMTGLATVKAEVLKCSEKGSHKYTAIRFGYRGRIILDKRATFYEIADVTDVTNKVWYGKK